MKVGLDPYDRNARLKPALLFLLPVTLTVAALVPGEILGWSGVVAAIIQAGGTFLLAQVVGDIGKRKESKLFRLWGGRPTEVLMSHRGCPNKITLAQRHKKMAALVPGAAIPTAEDEKNDPTGANEIYAVCADKLRGMARNDQTKGTDVHRENIHYGFRRNVWALKAAGVVVAVVATVTLGAVVGDQIAAHDVVNPLEVVVLIIDVLFIVAWTLVVNTEWVRRAAMLYAERLMETLDTV